MVSIINNNLFNNSLLGLKNSSAGMLEAFKDTLKEIDPAKLEDNDSPLGEDDIISEQTNEFLNGPGGVSGFVEENFEDPSFNNLPITNPSLIKDPTELATISAIPDTSFLDAATELQRAQNAFKNSINIVDKAQENERGRILDLFDNDDE